MTGGNNIQSTGVITSEMSGGGLKITYEKQPSSTSLALDLQQTENDLLDVPTKRSRLVFLNF